MLQDQSQSNIILTLCIVVILGLGMGLVAMDMQAILMDPIERISTVFKVIAAILIPPKKKEKPKEPEPKRRSSTGWSRLQPRASVSSVVSSLDGKLETLPEPEESYDAAEDGSHLNPVRVLNDYWRALMGKLVQLEEGFPPDEPLALFITAIMDIEVAFGISMKARRKMLVALEKDISVPYIALRRIVFAGDAGSLSLNDLLAHFMKLFSALKAMLPSSIMANPAHRLYIEGAEALLQTLPDGIVVAERLGQRALKGIGMKVNTSTELSSGMVYAYMRVQMQLLVRVLNVLAGNPVPEKLLALTIADCVDELEELARHALYAGFRTAGVQLEPKALSRSPREALRQLQQLLAAHLVAQVRFRR